MELLQDTQQLIVQYLFEITVFPLQYFLCHIPGIFLLKLRDRFMLADSGRLNLKGKYFRF